ncbi:MAG: iron ABC transporter permease [Hyphomicrobium sp.]
MSIAPPLQMPEPAGSLGPWQRTLRSTGRAVLSVRDAAGWSIAATLIAAVFALPLVAVVMLAFGPGDDIWRHLASTVLPAALANTLMVLLGAGVLTLVTGTTAAWLVTMYRFPGRAIADRLLVLPLSMPTYIVAYAYAELLDYAGPVQSGIRALFGFTRPADYFFPDVRSLTGAIAVFSAVLYPYVYLTARASFVQQSVCVLEVARTLGRSAPAAFWSVALPMARPALAAGVALVLMECLNDLGAVQYLGVETLTASVYATWMQRSNLAGAAQLATVMLVLVVALLVIERLARGGARMHGTTGRYRAIPFETLEGWRGRVAFAAVLTPFVFGFLVPFLVLARHALAQSADWGSSGFLAAGRNSLILAGLVSLTAVALALFFGYAARVARNPLTDAAARTAATGYALPGTVLAIGLMIPLALFDNAFDAWMRQAFGLGTGLLLSGSLFAVTLALVIRFLAVALGSVEAGLSRISPSIDAVGRTLGASALTMLMRVHVPLLVPALGAAALLVFVDAMKELPATLLMRPFNFETLATHVYGLAAAERFEEAAVGAIAIVVIGLVPVLLLHKTVAEGRTGSAGSGA